MRVLIAGCGDVGCRLARRLLAEQHTVFGLRRTWREAIPGLARIAGDLSRPDSLHDLPDGLDALVFMPAPGERTPEAYRAVYVDGLDHLAAALPATPGRVLVVSSTSVYGQNRGEWVDEDSAACPESFNGRILLEMESAALALGPEATVVRLAGIYGPGRRALLQRLHHGPVELQREPPVWSNRIHSDDAAGVLHFLLGLRRPKRLYLGADSTPAPLFEVLSWLAEEARLPPPVASKGATPRGKRVSNGRLRASGCPLQYADFKAGYRTILDAGHRV